MASHNDSNSYNPFYIEPSGMETGDFGDSPPQNMEGEMPRGHPSSTLFQGPSPSAPPKSVKTRKRGYSLRSQLLNPNIHRHSDPTQDPPEPTASQSLRFPYELPPASEDIELRCVENSYNPNDLDFVRNVEDYPALDNTPERRQNRRDKRNIRFDTSLTNESVMDISDDVNYSHNLEYDGNSYYNKNSADNRIRLSTDDRLTIKGKLKNSINPIKQVKSAGFFKRMYLLLSGGRSELPSVGGRKIPITMNLTNTEFPKSKNKKNQPLLLDERTNLPYVNNTITSSRYTLISFVPRQLIAQFSKLANCYFMLVAVLQLIPSWSTTGTSTTIIPLCIFISISMLREGWEDIKRHKLDKQENNKHTMVLKELESPNSLFESDTRFSKSTTSLSKLRPSGQSFDFNFEDDIELENKAEEVNSFQDEKILNGLGINAIKTKWSNVKVGDIVKLESDEWVPADVMLLTSSNEMGETFVETMALDGETNLKSKIPNIELHKVANMAKNLFNLSGVVLSEDPNLDLYNYEGSLDLPNLQTQEMQTFPLGPDNVIYRGSIIRNTDSCLGLVIFTGEETKIRMNAIKNPRIKAPKLQKKINMIVAFMVFIVLILSCFSLMAERLFYNEYEYKNWYIFQQDVGVAATIMGFIIMFNTMIPLSLYVTMEIIKAVQLQLLQWDIDMYHLSSDTPAEARTATILEELGQVSYIFSDKTGTLTDNVMIFRKFSVCGVPWIHDIDLIINNNVEYDPNDISDVFANKEDDNLGRKLTVSRPSMASLSNFKRKNGTINRKNIEAGKNEFDHHDIKSSLDFIKYIQSNPKTLFSRKASFFLLSIALCHTCLPRKIKTETENDNRDSIDSIDQVNNSTEDQYNPFDSNLENSNMKEDQEIEYQASSPDELALVQAACDMGFILYDRKQKILTLKTYPNGFDEKPELTKYEILDIVEFTSARKRMSVIVKFPDNRIVLLCKGADNIILERLSQSDVVSRKQSELSRSVSQRKKAEADFILNRKSIENNVRSASPRNSFASNRLSLSISQNSEQIYDSINAVLGHNDDDEANQIFEKSRKSMEMENMKKYNLTKGQYIPPNNLLLDDQFLIERTLQHIDEFSSEGLRTLLYSYRDLEPKKYYAWSKRYADAKTSLVDRSEKIEKIGKEFEEGLTLLGCTAIEDKLQDGVPETIDKLRKAGIRMWMLTGDKRETAINIGYSCKLIKDYSTVIILSNEEKEKNEEKSKILDRITSILTATQIEIDEGNIAHCVVVIDGSTLTDLEQDDTLLALFISLGVKADSVIVCRASPSQKAKMVLKVRELDNNKVTLAIGDGANDIAMIQSADVGVGITGKEGLQAARTSDYSIAQFRYLLKLLLVHGRYNYIRTSKFVLCTFYKELLFYLSQLCYQRYTIFTGSSLYESWSLSMFNTLFTSLPVLCIGMYDKDLKPSTLIAIPELYRKGVNNETFNLIVFIQWILLAASQSVTLTFTTFYIFGFPALIDNTTYPLGVILFSVFIILINTKLNIIEMHTITKLSIISWSISVFGWIVWCMLLVGLYKSKINSIFYVSHGLFEEFGRDPSFWASILALVVIGILIDFIFYFISHLFYSTDTEKFQLFEKDVRLQKKFELESYNELKQGWMWLHESQIHEEQEFNKLNGIDDVVDITNKSTGNNKSKHERDEFFKTELYNFRSFMKKGSIHPSKETQNRKRKGTMVNPNELPPDSPSLVKIRSNDEYSEEMLPSGEIVKILKSEEHGDEMFNRSYKKFFNSNKKKQNSNDDMGGMSIDEILRQRQIGLDEYEGSS